MHLTKKTTAVPGSIRILVYRGTAKETNAPNLVSSKSGRVDLFASSSPSFPKFGSCPRSFPSSLSSTTQPTSVRSTSFRILDKRELMDLSTSLGECGESSRLNLRSRYFFELTSSTFRSSSSLEWPNRSLSQFRRQPTTSNLQIPLNHLSSRS